MRPVRREDLLVRDLDDSSVVYDPATGLAHSLDRRTTAALRAVQADEPADPHAVAELVAAGLLVEPDGLSRRSFMHRGALVGAGIGVGVMSTALPAAADSASGSPGSGGVIGTRTLTLGALPSAGEVPISEIVLFQAIGGTGGDDGFTYAVPNDGLITAAASLDAGQGTSTLTFQVWRATPAANQFRLIAASRQTFTSSGKVVSYSFAPIPVLAGDLLGLFSGGDSHDYTTISFRSQGNKPTTGIGYYNFPSSEPAVGSTTTFTTNSSAIDLNLTATLTY